MLRSPLKIALCLSLPFVTLALYLILFSSTPQVLFAQSFTSPLAQNLIKSVVSTPQEESSTLFIPIVEGASSAQSSGVEIASLPTPTPDWLTLLNYYRSTANLPSLDANTAWNEGAALHARYMVKNNVLAHSEEPTNSWYTPEGQVAGSQSNIMGSHIYAEEDEFFINSWMQGPFHAVGILSPHLEQVGYGSYTENTENGLKTAAALNIIEGMTNEPDADIYPIMWPADGQTIPLHQHTSEYPQVPASCPGYSLPTGLPILLQIGSGHLTPDVTSHSFLADGAEIDSCVFDETSYTNPDLSAQSLGRAILNTRDAIVLVPRQPLTGGVMYTASITVNDETYHWSFEVVGN